MAELDYYKILGVSSDATASQIKARYQELAKKFHPDHSGDDNLMSLINEAYSTLSDPQKRVTYDNRSKSTGKTSSSNTSGSTQQRPHNAQSQNNQRTYSSQQSYTHQTHTPPPRPEPKPHRPTLTPQQVKQQQALQARIKQLEWWIKYPYILPGIFGLFVILAASSSQHVNHTTWTVWTIILVVIFSYVYQQLLKTSLRKVRERAKQVASGANATKKNGAAGAWVTIIVIAALAIFALNNHSSSGNSPTSNNSPNVTPTQAVINSKNQYYTPTYQATYAASYEQNFAISCMDNEANTLPTFSQYTSAQQIRFCGCSLAVLEQNYTYAQAQQIQEAVNSGTPATALNNADIQQCSGL